MLTDAEGKVSKLRMEVTRLQGLLVEAEGKASLAKHRVSNVIMEAIEAFEKGEYFYKELLISY